MLGGWFVLSSLLGRFSFADANQWHSKIVMFVATAIAAGLLYKAYQTGEIQSRWSAGTLWVVAAVVAVQVVMVAGAFLLWGKA